MSIMWEGREDSKGVEQPLVQLVTEPTTKLKREAKILRAYSKLLVYHPYFPLPLVQTEKLQLTAIASY